MARARRILVSLSIKSLLIVLLATVGAAAEELRFTNGGIESDARRYETYLRANWPSSGNGGEMRAAGKKLLDAGSDPRAAARSFAQAVVFDANDADAWSGL